MLSASAVDGSNGSGREVPHQVADVMKMREASLRLLDRSIGTATADPGGGRSVERGATSDGVERLVEDKRV